MRDYRQKLKEYKDFFYPLFILGLVLVSLKIFFLPKVSEIFAFRETRENREEQIKELNSYLSYLQELVTFPLGVEEEILNYALPPEKDVISLIITYEGLGKVEGITLSPLTLKPGLISEETKREKTLAEIPFEMKVEAENAEAAKRFLQEILLARRILDIKDLKWSLGEEKRVDLELSLTTYYFPQTEVKTNARLLKRGENQTDLLEKLRNTKVYEEEILELSPTGKEDLFSR